MNPKKVIAQLYQVRGDRTLIKPIYSLNENNDFERVGNVDLTIDKFPNKGTIIIWREREDFVYNYGKQELFLIGIEESATHDPLKENSCKFQSFNGDISSICKLPLIIKADVKRQNDRITLPYPAHKLVFIENGNYIYGPYSIKEVNEREDYAYDDDEYTDEEDQNDYYDQIEKQSFDYVIRPLAVNDLGLDASYQNVIHKFQKSELQSFIVENWRGSIHNENYIYNEIGFIKNINPVDYILDESDSNIIKWAERSLPKKHSRDELESVLLPIENNLIDKKRFERYTLIREKNTEWISFIDSYLKEKYINTPEGQERINLFLHNNADSFIKTKGKEIEEKALLQKKELFDEIERIKTILDDERRDVSKLSELKKQLEDESQTIIAKNQKLQELEEQIKAKAAKLDLLNEIEKADERHREKLNSYAAIDAEVQRRNKQLLELKKELSEESQKRLNELYPFVKAITEVYEPKKENCVDFDIEEMRGQELFSKEIENLNSYFKEAHSYLKSKNRNYSEIDCINLLTSIHQNFVTIFVGLPGAGKTSLANILSEFISSPEFSIEIPVGRGWNSKKSLLGFYNAIRGEYQPDEYGFINKLKVFNHFPELSQKIPLTITLDEANLSSIEHYWSDFITLCDKEQDRELRINDSEGNVTLRLPDGFKFIFTVNHDHTTELLSPRLLDRACIVKLNYDAKSLKSSNTSVYESDLVQFDRHYSQKSISKFFRSTNEVLSIPEEKTFDDIMEIIADKDPDLGKQIPVSPRKIKSIKQYCSVVSEPFKLLNADQFLALDYAILQFIIPLINGQGSSYENRLNKLKDELQKKSLTKSAQEVEDILKKGKDFQYYSYFS